MSFPVSFFWFQKKENSTKRPTSTQVSAGKTVSCTLLENTSILNPTFKISMQPDINAWNERWEEGNISTSTGQPVYSNLFIRSIDFCGCVPGITYYGKSSGINQLVIYWYDVQKNYISYAVATNRLVTSPANAAYFKIRCEVTSYNNDISINTPSSNTDYHAYSSLMTYNYCFVSEFERFYFINDISTDKNFWYVSCTCDVLATYRDTILSGSHYVLRSASAYDEYISDPVYPTKVEESGTQQAISDPFAYTNGHSYVWCVTGNVINGSMNNQQIGSNVYYWMSDLECYTFISKLLDVQQYSDIQTSEYSAAMQQALLNPIQYINSVVLLPFSKDTSLATNNHVKFGYYDIEIVAAEGTNPTVKRLTQGTMVKHQSVTCSIPKHPQAATRGKYMNSSPYTTYELFLGPFGTIPLDPASLVDETTLEITYRMELATGMCQIFVGGSSSGAPIIYTGSAQVGAMVSVSQLTKDYLGEVKNQLDINTATGGALASIALGGLGAAGGVSNSIMQIGSMAFDAVRYRYPTVSGGGVNGSFLGMHSTSYLQARFYNVVDQNNTEIGRPLYQTKTLSTLSGFALCSGADVAITGTSDEAVKVNSYLNSGFYIE